MINMSALQNRIILQSGSSIHPQCPELFAKKLIFVRFYLGRPILPGTASDGTIATLVQGQTERHHLEKYAAAELPPTPPRPSLFVRLPDKEGRAGRGWQLDDDVTTNVS